MKNSHKTPTDRSNFTRKMVDRIRQYILDNIHSDKDNELERKVLLMYTITGSGIFFLALLGLLALSDKAFVLAACDFTVMFFLIFLLWQLRHTGNYIFCSHAGVAIMICLFLYLFCTGGVNGSAHVWLFTFPLFALYLLGSRHGALATLFLFIPVLIFSIIELQSEKINLYSNDLIFRFIPSFLTVFLFSFMFEKSRETGHEKLVHASNTLEERVKKRTLELQEAYNIINNSETVAFVWENSEGWPVKFVSENVEQLIGYSVEELLSGSVAYFELIHPDDVERVGNEVACAGKDTDQDKIKHEPYRIITKDKKVKWVSDNSYIKRDQEGRIIHYQGIVEDITRRKKAEHEIATAKERWERTFESIADIITIQDKEMHIVQANKAAYRFFQESPGGLNGKSCYKVLYGITEPCRGCPLPHTVNDGGTYSEIINHEKLGKIFQVSSSPIVDENGEIQYLVHIARDITEQKKQEQLALEINQKKEQLRQHASLKTMAGAIAHRFNNSMMAVQSNLDILNLTLPADSDEKQMTTEALLAAKEASSIGSMLLTYVGQRPQHLCSSSLADLVRESVTELKGQFLPSISLKFIPPPEPLYCLMDQQQIKKVLISIMTNALESLPDEGGGIEISFGTDVFDTSSFPVPFQDDSIANGRYTFCQIKDTGHGISHENIHRLFDPFFTTRFVGRGLGLSLTVGIMQTHHGAVTVESSQGEGTTVRVLLPAVISKQERKEAPEGKKSDTVQLSGNILLADDENIVLDVGRKMLGLLGFTVHVAVDGKEAVEMVRSQDTDFRAVVLDISMPDMDGIEAMKQIRTINSDLPVLLSSGYSMDDLPITDDQYSRPDGFLQKPFQLSDLYESLEKLLS